MSRIGRLAALGMLPAACVGVALTAPAYPEKKPVPSFTREIRPFLSKYCYECHQEGEAKKGIDVTSYKKLTEGTGKKKKRIVVPGQPDQSRLVRSLEGKGEKRMPPRKYNQKPTAEEIQRVRDWIAAGAPDDSRKKVDP